jgi:predicted DNA-binding transcriptional regulator YafY
MSRGDQLIRQWGILNLIEARHYGITIEMLAQEVGCTTRTIRRDLEALELTGFPLYTEEIDGELRWMMMNAFKHAPKIPFTITELLSLYFSRDLLRVLKGTPFYESIESILDKIRKTILPETLEHLGKLEQSFYVAQKKHKDYGRFKAFLDQLMDATTQSKTVEIKYHTMHSDKTTVRKVDPYKMWYFDNTFFLIGRCHRNDDVRMFVVDRIKALKILTENFRIPSDFSVEDYMRDSFGVIHGKKVKVVVRFDKEVAGYIKEKKWHSSQKIKQHSDGRITATFTIAGTNEIKYWILSYGHHAEVLEPKALRDEIKHDFSLALKRY